MIKSDQIMEKEFENEFEKIVAEAVDALPERAREKIRNVAFLVENKVRRGVRGDLGLRMGDDLLGLYEGVPNTARGEGYSALPDRITIFRDPIEKICAGDEEKIRRLVHQVVWHEVGHFFGFGEESIQKLEFERFGSEFMDEEF